MSSGQNTAVRFIHAVGPCGFEGNVDAVIDPEQHRIWWDCPPKELGGCGKQHETAIEGDS